MSEFIKSFRVKNPQYDDMPDDQLVTALHNKYYSDIPTDQFNQQIGFQSVQPLTPEQPIEQQPIQEQQIDGFTGAEIKSPEEKSMFELVQEKASSIGGAISQGVEGAVPQFKKQVGGLLSQYEPMTKEEYKQNDPEMLGMMVNGKADTYENFVESFKSANPVTTFLADKGKELVEDGKVGIPQSQQFERGTPEYYAEAVTGSILNMAPTLAISLFGRRPDIGLGVMLAQVKGGSYQEGREQGLTTQDAAEYSSMQTAAEVIPSAFPIAKIMKPTGKYLKDILDAGVTEAAQETVTAALQSGIDKGYIKPDMTWGEAKERMIDGAIIGSASGAGISATTSPLAKELGSRDLKKQENQEFESAFDEALTEDAPIEKTVIDSLDPGNAQLEKTSVTKKIETSELWSNLSPEEQAKFKEVLNEVEPTVAKDATVDIKEQPIDKAVMPEQEAVAVELPKMGTEKKEAAVVKPDISPVVNVVKKSIKQLTKSGDIDLLKNNLSKVNEDVKYKNALASIVNAANVFEIENEGGVKTDLARDFDQEIINEALSQLKIDDVRKKEPSKQNIVDVEQAKYDEAVKPLQDEYRNPKTTSVRKSEILKESKKLRTPLDSAKSQLLSEQIKNEPKKEKPKEAVKEKKTFKGKVYHQTDKAFDSFDFDKSSDGTVWFTSDKANFSDPSSSASAASGKGRVIEKEIQLNNVAGFDELDKYSVGELIQQGYDGAVLDGDVQVFSDKTLKKQTEQKQPVTDSKSLAGKEKDKGKQQVAESDIFTNYNAKDDEGQPIEQSFTKGEYAKAVKSDRDKTFFKGGEIQFVSQPKKQVKINDQWYGFDSIVKAEKPEVIKPPTKKISKVVESVNKSKGKGLTDSDKVPSILNSVSKSSAVTTFNGSKSADSQVKAIKDKQTQLDIDKAAESVVQEASMSRDGKITYPKPEEDINTKEYRKLDNKMIKPPGEGQRIFNAPGHNYVGLFRSMGIPERREFVMIEKRKLKIPEEPQRIEPIISKLVKIMGRRIYFGKIKGKSSEGFYRPAVGEIRTRKKNDVEVLAHEMAHYLDFYSTAQDSDTSGNFLPNFQKLYKQDKFKSEIVGLSYTTADREIELIEGFAEFVRLWLTNSQEALIRAPKFYDAFTKLVARDRKLLNPMRDMQDLMHKFYFQGPDKLGQALIGKDTSFSQRFNEWAYRRDSRIRQQMIDRFHGARKVEQELSGKIGNVKESAWKQFRLANGGSEGISDYIMNYGTVNFDEKGDLQPTGKSLHEVLQPVKTIKLNAEHKKDQKIDLLLRYFAGRRALELHRQGRENLIPKETAKEWARLGATYPIFDSIQKDYQAFNDRMMDFYAEAGMITPEGRETMQKMNKDYVPFNRIRDQLAGGKGGSSSGFQKLRGGTANLNDILVNIQDGITANVKSALDNRAKQRLYQYISGHKDGAIFATKLAPDSKPVQVYSDEMLDKIGKILELNGVVIDGDIDLGGKDLLTFWQHGVKPQLNESGNIVDSVIIDGKPRYYEVQDPLLQDMLLSMNPESYSSFMNVMFGIKNFFTRTITLGVEFTGANLVRDTVGATFLSKNNFKPFIDSFKGMYSFISKDEHYQNFVRSGAGYSSRLEAMTKEGNARRRVKLDEFGIMSTPERLLSTIDNIASAFEYGTRIGEFRLAKKNNKSDMDAGFEAREISTDFSVLGANRFLTGYIRTVPFLNAMIQSQDRVFREAVVTKKYDGNPTGLAMKAFLGITIPTLILYLVNKDDDDYKAIPDWEKRTNWHIKIGDNQFVKIPRPYDVGFVYATMPELFYKYLEDDKGKEFAEGMIWTMTQMYGIDGVPAMMTGWWDLVKNEKWTGAPVVPTALADVAATEQYSSNTSETFIRMGEALGVSPVKAEHMFKAYTGYLGGYVLWGTDHMLWDEDKFGEKPESQTSDNIFLKRFLTPDTRPATSAMDKFFDLKEKSDRVVSTFKQQTDVRRAIKGQIKEGSKFKDNAFFGLSGKEKEVLFALNDSMNDLIKLMYGKEGIKTAELKVKHNKKLSGKRKREELDRLWNSRNDAFMKYYLQADKAMQKAKQESENFKQPEN